MFSAKKILIQSKFRSEIGILVDVVLLVDTKLIQTHSKIMVLKLQEMLSNYTYGFICPLQYIKF
jgi:hypothetical protein